MKRFLKYCGVIFLLSWIMFWVGDYFYPLNLSRFADHSTVIYSNQKPVHIFHTKDEKLRILITVKEVDKLYLKTLLAREDRFFKFHFGINPLALIRGVYLWTVYGRIISGGSTITMQTARLLEPRPRKISAKLLECFRALQLEWHLSKDEILSIYMTLAPFGGNIEGIHAASVAYFNKSPQALTASEIALLVALVQSPNLLRPDLHPERAFHARLHILELMAQKGLITSKEANIQKQAPLPFSKTKLPREIPHLAWRLKKQFPKQSKINTSIDMRLQHQVENLLQHYSRFLPHQANAAIFIIDHIQNKPIVYIGSRDFYAEDQHGFVDYITAYRSPGSTLKPFIYGLGFDLGLIQPNTYVLDERRYFGNYAPRNFARDIRGVVEIKEALALSLNIPVVAVLNQIGPVRFLGLLKEAGVEPRFPSSIESPSLAIALGGVGMTLEQLVNLYATLPSQTPILSKHSSDLITKILATQPDEREHSYSFKTGTSYGHRDALVIGYDQRYVVGIWTGLPSGASMGPVSARTTVVPLLEKIFKILPQAEKILAKAQAIQLKDLSQKQDQRESTLKEVPRLLFPVHDTVIEQSAIPLTVSGGIRPYTWLIDGKPLVTQCWQLKHWWTPQNKGFYTISVVDALGQAESAYIEIR